MKTILKLILFVILTLLGTISVNATEWVCKSQSSITQAHNVVLACGIGESKTEISARQDAYNNALREFKTTCNESSDCRGNKVKVRPKRTECEKLQFGIRCYRAIIFEIEPEAEDLDEELSRRKIELASLIKRKKATDDIIATKLSLKFQKPNPSYWSLGLGISLNGTDFANKSSLQVGYGLNLKYCFKDIICPLVGLSLGQISTDQNIEKARFWAIYGGGQAYLVGRLYILGSLGLERQSQSNFSDTGIITNLGLGLEAVRVQNVSISVEGIVKGGPGRQVNGAMNIFSNFKF